MQKRWLPLLLALALLAGCRSATPSASKLTPTPAPAAPSPTATPLPGTLIISDAAIASQLSFAFVRANDVWVGLHGAAPQQVTHLGLPAQPLDWHLIWSADQATLLATESNDFSTGAFQGESWIIRLPEQAVTPLLDAATLTAGCTISCGWLGGRYLVHADATQVGSHAQIYHIYDIQTQRDLSTSLDSEVITEWQVHGSSLYFTPYNVNVENSPGIIKRFDLSSNQITTVFTVPGPLVSEGIPSGNWDLSADGRRAVMSFAFGITQHCSVGQCMTFYQDATGKVDVLFPSYQPSTNKGNALTIGASISPDGRYAAGLAASGASIVSNPTYSLIQQAIPSGSELENEIPNSTQKHDDWVLGWTSQGILVQQVERDTQDNPLATSIFFAPVASAATAHLVETIQAGLVVFAPLG
ncbi:MAG TPA: hypothetical protein VH540_16175 [Ktedonobacterales bacterium]|jgi:hypothetical protein